MVFSDGGRNIQVAVIRLVSNLHNYNTVLEKVAVVSSVYLTAIGSSRCTIGDIEAINYYKDKEPVKAAEIGWY